MTKLIYAWTNGIEYRNFKTYPQVVAFKNLCGGAFKAHYIEDKDVDYEAPNPARKSYAKRLIAATKFR